MRLSITILILVFTWLTASGQAIEQDSLITTNTAQPTSNAEKVSPFKGPLSMFSGNPGKAALYSLVLPGAGQYYNKKYWKIPFFLAAEGVAIGVFINNNRVYKRWNDCLEAIAANPPTVTDCAGRNATETLSIRNTTRTNRDYALVGIIAVHLIQVADAFVSRHLIEFDVSDNLSLNLNTNGLGPGLSLSYSY